MPQILFPGNSGVLTSVVLVLFVFSILMISVKNKCLSEEKFYERKAAVVSMNLEESNQKEIYGGKNEIN